MYVLFSKFFFFFSLLKRGAFQVADYYLSGALAQVELLAPNALEASLPYRKTKVKDSDFYMLDPSNPDTYWHAIRKDKEMSSLSLMAWTKEHGYDLSLATVRLSTPSTFPPTHSNRSLALSISARACRAPKAVDKIGISVAWKNISHCTCGVSLKLQSQHH